MADSEKNVKAKNPEYITLKVMSQDNRILNCYLKKHVHLRKLMQAYCGIEGCDQATVRFRFDGLPIKEADTPLSIGLEEGDMIEVYQLQIGG